MRAFLAAVWVVLAAGAAEAQATPEQSLAFLDREDHDGRVSLNEYLTFQQPRMAQFDKNGNGSLSQPEFEDALEGKMKSRASTWFKKFAEGKRSMDQKHFLGYHAWMFNTFIDEDRDGFVTLEEWKKLLARS